MADPRCVDCLHYNIPFEECKKLDNLDMEAAWVICNGINFELKGIKLDADKLRWDLVPWGFFEEIVKDLTFGAKKYAPDNWRVVDRGIDRYFAAAMRHLLAYRKGEYTDKESDLSHLSMAGCNLMFLWELEHVHNCSVNNTDSNSIQSATNVCTRNCVHRESNA